MDNGFLDDTKKWKLTNKNNGYFTLTSALGNYNININGDNVQISERNDENDSQLFTLKSTDSLNVYNIITKSSNKEKAINIPNEPNSNVVQQSYTGNEEQQWVFEIFMDGWYYIKNPKTKEYLKVENDEAKANAQIVIGTSSIDNSHKWKLTNTNDGYFTLTSALGNYNVDIDGNNVQLSTPNDKNSQRFILKATGTDNVYTISIKDDTNNVFNIQEKNIVKGSYKSDDDNQKWVFEILMDEWYYIRSEFSNKYLQVIDNKITKSCSDNVVIDSFHQTNGQKWKISHVDNNGYFRLISGLGDYSIDIANFLIYDGTNVQICESKSNVNAQYFNLRTATSVNYYFIGTCVSNSNSVFDVSDITENSNVREWYYHTDKGSQRWIFERGFYIFIFILKFYNVIFYILN